MGHKLNDFSKGIGSTFWPVGKLFETFPTFRSKEKRPKTADHEGTVAQPVGKDGSQDELLTAEVPQEDIRDTGERSPKDGACLAQDLTDNEENAPRSPNESKMPSGDSGSIMCEQERSDEASCSGGSVPPDRKEELLTGPTINYEVSDDCRRRLLEQCGQAVRSCRDLLPKRMEPEHAGLEDPPACTGAKPFLFDIVNCRVSDFSGSGASRQMPVYACMDDKEPSLCHQHGIYTQTLVDSYELFHDNRKETHHFRHSILRRSLEEVIGGAMPADGCHFMCLMPDIVDDFDQVFRAQLNYKGTPLFQVPRSIALAYTLQAEGWSLPEDFLCLDYDGEDFFAIKIRNVLDEDGEHIFIRMGREKVEGEHPSTQSLSLDYLSRYQKKYGSVLSEGAISNLVNTRRLQHLLFENSPYLLLDNSGTVASIHADTEILNEIAERIYEDMEQIQNEKNMTVYAMCSLFNDPSGSLYNISQMETGCKEICTRAEQGKTLWQEYLPDLRLEVNRNGCFDEIQLIGEEHRHQNINTFVLDEKVQIPVVDGTIIFPVNGAKHYDLPLVRETFGRHVKEKLARFALDKPLQKPVQVELSVHYQYGDIDSYQLVAYAKEMDQTIRSSWCDTESLILPNPAPSFSEATPEQHIISREEIEKVYHAFLQMRDEIKSPCRPPRHKGGSVYTLPKNPNWYYSKYLHELNRGGMPYFMIQNFFRREAFPETRTYISELLSEDVFSTIGGILRGDLPTGHELDNDSQMGKNESRILINNMADIASNFGIFFALKDNVEGSSQFRNAIDDILSYYKRKKHPQIQHWAPITKYVRITRDSHNIWPFFLSALSQLNPDKRKSTARDLRTISGVCFQTEDWIFDLYHSPNGRDHVERIIKSIEAILSDEGWLSERDPLGQYNPRKIRDILELLLCICRLKKEDPTILDCNAPRTKQLVKRLKKIDSDMRMMEENGLLNHTFNSRLGITAPEAYSRVNPVIYALIETLSGGGQVSLIGFSDKETDD